MGGRDGKTVLVSSFYGATQEEEFWNKSLFTVTADDTGLGHQLLANYLGLQDSRRPGITRLSSTAYAFSVKLRGRGGKANTPRPFDALRLVWHDYPGALEQARTEAAAAAARAEAADVRARAAENEAATAVRRVQEADAEAARLQTQAATATGAAEAALARAAAAEVAAAEARAELRVERERGDVALVQVRDQLTQLLAATTPQTGTGAGKALAAKRAATKPRPARRAAPGQG